MGGLLGALAVAVAFGPELRRALVHLRRRGEHPPQGRRALGVEPTRS